MPILIHSPLLCARSASLRDGADSNCAQWLLAPSIIVLRTLIARCAQSIASLAVLHDPNHTIRDCRIVSRDRCQDNGSPLNAVAMPSTSVKLIFDHIKSARFETNTATTTAAPAPTVKRHDAGVSLQRQPLLLLVSSCRGLKDRIRDELFPWPMVSRFTNPGLTLSRKLFRGKCFLGT